jgi:uncharacterized protein with ParB-like and HNH nuclease domain
MAKSDLKFDAKDTTIGSVLFSENKKFQIPRYQRPYAWTIEQVSEFWEDLLTNAEPYFLGSLIFNLEGEEETGYIDIIDGQQRLLTITILMSVLRDAMKSLDQDKAKLYQRKAISIENWKGGEAYRIVPSDTLKDYFIKYIQSGDLNILESEPTTDEERKVKVVYEYLKERIDLETKRVPSLDAKAAILEALRDKVANLIVINVEIAKEEDAYEIFETTNARGVELSVADLLKNLIFKKIPAGNDRDLAKDVWQDISVNIESTDTELKKFIRYYWISRYSPVTEKRLYREIKNKVKNWQSFLEDVWDASDLYNKMLEGTDEDFQHLKHGLKIYNSLMAIRYMGVSQCYVFLLAILRNYERMGTDPARIFQIIENFSFQYHVVSKLPGNRVEKIYSKYALDLEEIINSATDKSVSGKVQSLFTRFEKELRELAPTKSLFIDEFEKISYRNAESQRKLVKYILSRIDGHLRTTDENKIDFYNVNIEHILPQNPNKDWKVDKKEIKPYVNKLGNLTLLSKKINSKVQNGTIEQKLPDFEKSELPINSSLIQDLKKTKKWGEKEIIKRQKALAEIAYNDVWKM